MSRNEITVPKELREFMPDSAEETVLGYKNGANKQYRYGNLHIREYDDKFLVHSDRADPRKDALGHLIYDAPEILIGVASAILGGVQVAKILHGKKSGTHVLAGIVSSAVSSYLSYTIAKKMRNRLDD